VINLEKIKNYLIFNDTKMAQLINDFDEPNFLEENLVQTKLFDSLINSIVSQQLSTRVAKIIRSRLYSFKNIQQFTPIIFLDFDVNDMRACGLSGAKCRYIKSISKICFESPDFLNNLIPKTDQQIIAELTNLYGVGEWTAQMFLIFALKRIDVFALNDAGLLKGIRHTYFHGELVGLDRIQDVVNTWKPYRTIGAWYMWQVANSISH
tara:strand:+ start:4450 stop:5073 length:624 start_codon:yes stop_codon:yes gene_type:complete